MAQYLNGVLFINAIGVQSDRQACLSAIATGPSDLEENEIEIGNASGSPISLENHELWSARRGRLYRFQSCDVITGRGLKRITSTHASQIEDYASDGTIALFPKATRMLQDTIYLIDGSSGDYIGVAYGDVPKTEYPEGFPGLQVVSMDLIRLDDVAGMNAQRVPDRLFARD